MLTLLTVLPLVGAAIALFAGRHARGVAHDHGVGRSLVLALVVWTHLPADGSIGLVERTRGRRRWASSITSAWMGWAR